MATDRFHILPDDKGLFTMSHSREVGFRNTGMDLTKDSRSVLVQTNADFQLGRGFVSTWSDRLRSVPLLLMALGLCVVGCSSEKELPPEKHPVDVKQLRHDAGEVKNRIDLAWLPSDAELFVHLKVAELWQAPLLQQLVVLPAVQQNLMRMKQWIGLKPADVSSVTLAVSGISERVKQGTRPNPMSLATTVGDKSLAVVRLSKSVDAASLRLAENRGESVSHSGQTYYRFAPPAGSEASPVAVYLAGPQQLVIGTEKQVQAAISRGERQTRRPDLDFVDPNQHLLIVFVPQDVAALTAGLPDGGSAGGPAAKAVGIAKNNLKALCLGIRIGDGVDLAVQLHCTGEAVAGKVRQQFEVLIKQGRDAYGKSRGKIPSKWAAAGDQVLGSLKTSQTGPTLTTSVSISQATVGTLKKSGKELAGLAMMAATMSGGGSGLLGSASPGLSSGGSTSEPPPTKLPTAAAKGIKTSAIARWSPVRTLSKSNGRELPRPLDLWVYLVGEQPGRAVAWGDTKVEKLRTDTGETLSQRRPRSGFDRAPKRFEPVKRGGPLSTHPRSGVKTVIRFDPPTKSISKITEVSGSVAIQVALESKPVIVRNIQSLVGKTIDSPELKQAGVTLRVTRRGNTLNLALEKGNPVVIGKVTAVDGKGKALRNVGTFRQGFGNRISYGLFLGSNAPADAGVELSLNLGLRQVDVPFHFKNVRVPLPPSHPGVPSATTTGVPAGLKLAAKTRWGGISRATVGGKQPLPPQLEVLVTIEGNPAARAVGWGFVMVKNVKGAQGLPLKLAPSQFGFMGKFHQIKLPWFVSQQSQRQVYARILLEHPSAPIQEVADIEGALQLRVARHKKTIVIPKFTSKVGKPIRHQELQAAGVQLKLEQQGNQFKLVLTKGDPSAVGKVDVIDGQGKTLKQASVYRFSFQEETMYNIVAFGKKFPDDAGLRVTLNLDLTTLKVPFRFKHLPVPDPPLH